MKRKISLQNAFSLTELMVVLVIIGVLVLLALEVKPPVPLCQGGILEIKLLYLKSYKSPLSKGDRRRRGGFIRRAIYFSMKSSTNP
ncbi:MAG: prepilin-type N-terminal cleavage/methylation domain-containing protein [Bacteroidota bacterium]